MKENRRGEVVNKSTCLCLHRKKRQSSVITRVSKACLARNTQGIQLRETEDIGLFEFAWMRLARKIGEK